jgi:transcriptional regulator with XRE-family HTH domain
MKTPTSADALRVARTLIGYSQRAAAEAAGVLQKSIFHVERGDSPWFETNLRLVDFYEKQGIEFLGEPRFGKEIERAGARWMLPEHLPPTEEQAAKVHESKNGVSFKAARSLIGIEQTLVAAETGLTVKYIGMLEKGGALPDQFEVLRQYYISEGVEFVGWGDVSRNIYFGVGVRWSGVSKRRADKKVPRIQAEDQADSKEPPSV